MSLTLGHMYSCSDNGKPGNILSPVLADNNGGWNTFSFLFAGKNALGQNRIYAVNERGQLLSYAPTNPLSGEVIVGADGWGFGQNFSAVFAGVNLLGENQIYAVTMRLTFTPRANCCPTVMTEIPAMSGIPWSPARAYGWTCSCSSSPARTRLGNTVSRCLQLKDL